MSNSKQKEGIERSPELLALEKRFRKLREELTIRDHEPQASQGGITPAEFLEVATDVADNYSPSGYLSSAPKP